MDRLLLQNSVSIESSQTANSNVKEDVIQVLESISLDNSLGFENIRDQLSDAEKKPKDYTPWNILRKINLPKKVRNTVDNKIMILIEGGLQSDEDGKEIWIYPFYIDDTGVPRKIRNDEPIDLGKVKIAEVVDYDIYF